MKRTSLGGTRYERRSGDRSTREGDLVPGGSVVFVSFVVDEGRLVSVTDREGWSSGGAGGDVETVEPERGMQRGWQDANEPDAEGGSRAGSERDR